MRKFLFLFVLFLCDIVHASNLELVPISGVYSSHLNMSNGSYFSSNQKKYFMDGRIVYCVEPGAPIYTNYYDGVSDLGLSGISDDVLNEIRLIGYFGYDYPGHNTDRYFMAAQELIWELVGNNEVHFTTGISSTGDIVNIDYEKNEIMSLVNRYYYKPSFDGESVSGVYGSTIVLSDSNNVLSNYYVEGDSAFIDDDRLVINVDKLGSSEIILKRKMYDNSSSIFYSDVSSQDFMFLRPDSVISVVSLEGYIPRSTITVNKKGLVLSDYSDEFIYEEEFLNGVHFGLYASSDIYEGDSLVFDKDELVYDFETVEGLVSPELPNGDYYLKELETLPGYVLDTNVYHIELYNDRKEVFNYMIDLFNERQRIVLNLSKVGEVFDKVLDDSCSYSDVPLAGIKFGLYSGNDIYSASGILLINKDQLISEFITDMFGNIDEEVNIPFGTYYLKELETLPGYKIDNNIYEFNISKSDDDIIKVMVTKEPIINEVIKSKLVIVKIDEFGNRLEGATFKIFDSNDKFIYEGITDSNGVLSIDGLSYGKYYFYEVLAPTGYVSSSKIYEVFVNKDNDLIEVTVLNTKLPLTNDIYEVPKKISSIGLCFGFLTLSVCVIYEKCRKS